MVYFYFQEEEEEDNEERENEKRTIIGILKNGATFHGIICDDYDDDEDDKDAQIYCMLVKR